VSGIHPPTLKVCGSNPHGGRNKTKNAGAKEDYKYLISIKYIN
jgi:hypothetical protein